MKKEYNNIVENNVTPEFIEQKPYEEIRDNAPVAEYQNITESDNDNAEAKVQEPRQTRRLDITSFLSSSMIAILAVVVVGITNLLNVSMKASMVVSDYNMTEGTFNLVINVTDMTEDEELNLYVYEDGKDYCKIPVDITKDEVNEVVEGKLSYSIVKNVENNNYEMLITLSNDKKTLIDTNISTLDNYQIKYEFKLKGVVGLDVEREFDSYLTIIEKHTCEVKDVYGHCMCQEDGYYHFTIDYTDPIGALTFKAYIVDSLGNTYECEFTEDYHEEQKIYVGDIEESSCKLYISYTEIGKEGETYFFFDNGNPEKDGFKNIRL